MISMHHDNKVNRLDQLKGLATFRAHIVCLANTFTKHYMKIEILWFCQISDAIFEKLAP